MPSRPHRSSSAPIVWTDLSQTSGLTGRFYFLPEKGAVVIGQRLVPPAPGVTGKHLEDITAGVLCPVDRKIEQTSDRDMDTDFYLCHEWPHSGRGIILVSDHHCGVRVHGGCDRSRKQEIFLRGMLVPAALNCNDGNTKAENAKPGKRQGGFWRSCDCCRSG